MHVSILVGLSNCDNENNFLIWILLLPSKDNFQSEFWKNYTKLKFESQKPMLLTT